MAYMRFVVYAPPEVGLPYLAVTIEPDGTVTAVAFGTEVETENYITVQEQKLARRVSDDS